jgi:hypothetical protein
MNEQLVIIHIIAEIIDSVTVVTRKNPGMESENQFLDRAIAKAESIVRNGMPSGFDAGMDTCAIFCVDPGTGESHEVWAMGVQDEKA